MKVLKVLFLKGVLVFGLIVLVAGCADKKGALDSDQLVMSTLWYQKSGEARALYYQAYNLAQLRVRAALDTLPKDQPLAVIADIDETILDNSPSEGKNIQEGKRFTTKRWEEWTAQRKAKALPGSLSFAQFLQANGVELFYISNRSIRELEPTIDNLKLHGFPYADSAHVFLKTESSNKTSRRTRVQKDHHIILFLGDNLNDFDDVFEDRSKELGFETVDQRADDFGKRFIVFPNPLYGSWSKPIYGSTSDMKPREIARKRKSFVSGF